MSGKKLGSLDGSPWHVTYLHMKEDDERRDKRRCLYHDKSIDFCCKRKHKCIGSAHCEFYQAIGAPGTQKPAPVCHKSVLLTPKRAAESPAPQAGPQVNAPSKMPLVKRYHYRISNTTVDAVRDKYMKIAHVCPYCRAELKCDMVKRGKLEVCGVYLCRNDHMFYMTAIVKMDGDIVLIEERARALEPKFLRNVFEAKEKMAEINKRRQMPATK